MAPRELTATEAAARLGIKKATLYAYVSRGLVTRRVGLDGRSSLFDAEEIESLRSERRRRPAGELGTVLNTAITHVADGDLLIRGADLAALARSGVDYEVAAERLWATRPGSWDPGKNLVAAVSRVQAALPGEVSPIDRLRVATVVASASDPLRFDPTPAGIHGAGRRLIGAMVHGLPRRGAAEPGTRLADVLWSRLSPRRGLVSHRDALNTAMVLLVDHGMAASTLAVRVAASVRADPYSAILSGLGVVGGTLHGAASAAVHHLLADAHRRGDAVAAIGDVQKRTSAAPGFGHAVYRSEDPRHAVLMDVVKEAWRGDPRLEVVDAVRSAVAGRSDALPNVDLALGSLTWLAEMDDEAGEAVFAIARTGGWLAHVVEEWGETPMRFRSRARYTGPRTTL